MKKQFAIPCGITSNQLIIDVFTDLYANKRYLFREDSEILCVYDAFSGIWTGGREIDCKLQDEDFIRSQINKFNDRGIPFRQIFSNFFIDSFLDDKRCNMIMDILSENKMNSVTITSDKALKIFKEKYPDLTFSSSVTKMILDISSFIHELEKDYDDVCMWIRLNNMEVWETIPEHLRYKVSILVCQNCMKLCPYSYNCALKISVRTLKQYKADFAEPILHHRCQFKKENTAAKILKQETTLLHEDLDKLVELGYNRFKITGRAEPINELEFLQLLTYYLVAPENYEEFIHIFESEYALKRN